MSAKLREIEKIADALHSNFIMRDNAFPAVTAIMDRIFQPNCVKLRK